MFPWPPQFTFFDNPLHSKNCFHWTETNDCWPIVWSVKHKRTVTNNNHDIVVYNVTSNVLFCPTNSPKVRKGNTDKTYSRRAKDKLFLLLWGLLGQRVTEPVAICNVERFSSRAGTTHRHSWRNRRHKFVAINNLCWRVVPNRKW